MPTKSRPVLRPTPARIGNRLPHPGSKTRVVLQAAALIAALSSSLAAQAQFLDLSRQHLPDRGMATWAVAAGDIDGDGDQDLIFGNSGSQNRVYRNDGTGVFSDVTAVGLPPDADQTTAVALGDLDGDGDLDLVACNWAQQNRLYRNDGTGVFTDVTSTHMPVAAGYTRCVALGDVDGDGDVDLMLGNDWGQQPKLYLNNGGGAFVDVTSMQMPVLAPNTRAIVLQDLDGDGDLDALLANDGQDRLLRNDGTGTFLDVTATHLPVDTDDTMAVANGDLDGDGDLDLVLGNYAGQNRVLLNNGLGVFSRAGTALPVESDGARGIVLGDIDADGDLDLIVANGGGGYFSLGSRDRLYLNSGAGVFTDATAAWLPVDADFTMALALADFDGRQGPDLVFVSAYPLEPARLLLHAGDRLVDATARRLPSTPPAGVMLNRTMSSALGDVDGDGDLDLVLAKSGQDVLLRNDGTGVFVDDTATSMPVDLIWTLAVALGDVDGDGDLDAVFGDGTGGSVRLYHNDGSGVFTDVTATHVPGGIGVAVLALGDIDQDGDLDLALGGNATGGQPANRLYRNDNGVFVDVTSANLPADPNAAVTLAFADVDGDGDQDLVLGCHGHPTIVGQPTRLYRNTGSGVFIDETASSMPSGVGSTSSVALADVDGDGALDLCVAKYAPPLAGPCGFAQPAQALLHRNVGGVFVDVTAAWMPQQLDVTWAVRFGDFDLDGDPDLLALTFGQVRLYQNSGVAFTDVTFPRMPTVDSDPSHALTVGDIDRDGDLDYITHGTWEGSSSCGYFGPALFDRVYVNLLRQLDSPFLLRSGLPWSLDVHARYGPPRLVDVALPYVSLAPAHIPLGTLGTVGIDPGVMIALPPLVVPQPAGVATLTVATPNNPALAGIALHVQALLLQWPTQDRLTNACRDVFVW